jgi:hypothetical protein
MAVSSWSETTVNDVAATVPKVTAVAPVKPEPVSVTEVPPAVEPVNGVTLVAWGSAVKGWADATSAAVARGAAMPLSKLAAVETLISRRSSRASKANPRQESRGRSGSRDKRRRNSKVPSRMMTLLPKKRTMWPQGNVGGQHFPKRQATVWLLSAI